MLKAFLRSAALQTQLDNELGLPLDILPVSEAALCYEKDHEKDLVESFENCVYVPDFEREPAEDNGLGWDQKTMNEIHDQLCSAFIRGAVSYGIDIDDVNIGHEPDQDPDSENGGVLVITRAREMWPTADQILCEKIYDFVLELQDCAAENYDEDDGEDGQLFEVLSGQDHNILIIRYDYEAMYNALNLFAPQLKACREVNSFLNSAYHVMDRYDQGAPVHKLN